MPTKRLACLLTCLLLVLTLPACGGKGAASEPEGPNEPAVSVLAPSRSPNRSPSCPTPTPHRRGLRGGCGRPAAHRCHAQ